MTTFGHLTTFRSGLARDPVFEGGERARLTCTSNYTFITFCAFFSPSDADSQKLGKEIQARLAKFFTPEMGFGTITHVDYTDGIRVLFDNGDVAHVRPSGNADELRIYTVADTQARADAIAAMGWLSRTASCVACRKRSPSMHEIGVLPLHGVVQHYD